MEKMHLQNVIFNILFLMLFGVAGIYAQPTVSSHTPTQYQQNVTAGTDIVVTFSDNIDGATIDATSFNVDGDAIGKIAGVYLTAGNQVTFNPDVDFKPGEVVKITLTTNIKSTGAVALNDDYTWQFTVESAVASGVFTASIISTTADGAYSVYAADVDGDGDMDVLSASMVDDKIAWYENDGSESFTENAISTSAVYSRSVYAADVNGDGDMDVLSASSWDDKIAWYENDGSEGFTEHVICQRRTTSYLITPPQNPGVRNYRTGLFSDTRFRDSGKML